MLIMLVAFHRGETVLPSDYIVGLVGALGRAVGIEALALDEFGACTLRFDDTVVMLEAEEHRLVLHAILGAAPVLGREVFLTRLLEANLLWKDTHGATLALDPRSDQVLMMQAVPPETPPVQFPHLVGRFVDAAEAWTAHLATAGCEQTPTPALMIDPSRLV